ncbi:MAG: UvrD-helicase domain-containing protein [Planctomycetia bacterium]|nr:UvrD-helicase domain-containing protein [Planctomycetia bacterium]
MTSIPIFENVLIRASAGTGKTYQLSNRYLGLVASGVSVDSILASTFTRKAAGEILNRILLRIAEAAVDPSKREELSSAVGMELTSEQCFRTLRHMTENLHRLHVHTLDGFFNRLASCFSHELNLPPGWRIMDDAENEVFIRDAIRQLLAKDPENAVRIMHALTLGKTQRNVQRQMSELIQNTYVKTLGASAEAWKKVDKIPLPRILESTELETILQKLESAVEEEQAKNSKFSRCASAVRKVITLVRSGQWDDLLRQTLIKNALEADKTSSPLLFNRAQVPAEIASAITLFAFHVAGTLLRQLVQQTYATHEMLKTFHEIYESLKLDAKKMRFSDITRKLSQFINDDTHSSVTLRMDAGIDHLLLDEFQDTSPEQWNILKPFARKCTTSVPEKSRTFFCVGDMKQAIYAWRGGKAAIFNAVTQFLDGISEFPLDTSFRSSPVIINCVNHIFENIPSAMKEELLPAWEKWKDSFHIHHTARKDYPGYWEIRTSQGTEESENRQELEGTEKAEDEPTNVSAKLDETLKFTALEVKKLFESSQGKISIGILARRRAPVTRIITHLRRLGIPASEEVGNPLTNSEAVRVILSLLRLADHPADTVSHFHVAHSLLIHHFPELKWVSPEEKKNWSAEILEEEHRKKQNCLSELRERFITKGYGKVLEEITGFIKPYVDPENVRRLEQLVELAVSYEPRKTTRPTDFVDFVEMTPLSDPTDAGVRVMSIHQSKGLQFDAVFLPDMEFPLDGGHVPFFVAGYPSKDTTAAPELVTRYIPKPLQTLLSPEFQEAFLQEKLQQTEEGLCMLYVALTRAIYALYVIVPPHTPKTPESRASKVSKILTRVMADTCNAPADTVLAREGDEKWWEVLLNKKDSEKTEVSESEIGEDILQLPKVLIPQNGEEDVIRPLSEIPGVELPIPAETYVPLRGGPDPVPILFAPGRKHGRGLRRRTPSQAEERTTIDLEKTMHFRAFSALRGTVLHAWFEKINWLEYSSPADDELYQIGRQHGLDEEMTHRSLQEFHNAMKNEKIRAVLSWKKYLPQLKKRILRHGILTEEQIPLTIMPGSDDANFYRWRVYCEKELAVRTEKEFLLGTIDRLVLLWGGEEVLWAECFDYKTSKRLPPEVLEEKVAKHRLQMLDYREMLYRHYRIPKEQVTAHLIFPMMGLVQEV